MSCVIYACAIALRFELWFKQKNSRSRLQLRSAVERLPTKTGWSIQSSYLIHSWRRGGFTHFHRYLIVCECNRLDRNFLFWAVIHYAAYPSLQHLVLPSGHQSSYGGDSMLPISSDTMFQLDIAIDKK